MEMFHIFLWTIYPYTVVAILAMGFVWQYDVTKVIDDAEVDMKTSLLLKRIVANLLWLSSTTGIAIIFASSLAHEPKQLLNWLVSVLLLNPDMELMMNISILSQVHLFFVLTLLLFLSFTKYITYLVHPRMYVKIRLVKKFNKL